MSNESGMNEVYVRPFVASPSANASGAGGALADFVPVEGCTRSGVPTARSCFLSGPRVRCWAAPIASGGSAIEPGKPVLLFQTRIYGGGSRQSDRDGSTTSPAMAGSSSTPCSTKAASAITLLQNWKAK